MYARVFLLLRLFASFAFLLCRLDWIECDYHSLRFHSCTLFLSSLIYRSLTRSEYKIALGSFLIFLIFYVIWIIKSSWEIVCMEIDIVIMPWRYFFAFWVCKEGRRRQDIVMPIVCSTKIYSSNFFSMIFSVRINNQVKIINEVHHTSQVLKNIKYLKNLS